MQVLAYHGFVSAELASASDGVDGAGASIRQLGIQKACPIHAEAEVTSEPVDAFLRMMKLD